MDLIYRALERQRAIDPENIEIENKYEFYHNRIYPKRDNKFYCRQFLAKRSISLLGERVHVVTYSFIRNPLWPEPYREFETTGFQSVSACHGFRVSQTLTYINQNYFWRSINKQLDSPEDFW